MGEDDMEKMIRTGLIVALVVGSMQAIAQRGPTPADRESTPMDKVKVLAGTHAITTGKRHGVYWIEVEGSDIFGTGATLDEAANDFLADADLIENEANRPNLRTLPQQPEPQINCVDAYCL
jgi:hypothetical protein